MERLVSTVPSQKAIAATLTVFALAVCARTDTASDEHGGTHWGTTVRAAGAPWIPSGSCVPKDASNHRSIFTNASTIELPGVGLHLPSGQEVEVLNQEGVIDALDNGHTIQINAKTGETLTVAIAGEGDTGVVLRWKPPVEGDKATFYRIQRKVDDSPWENLETSTHTEQLMSNQPRGVELDFRVFAVNQAGEGTPSATVTGRREVEGGVSGGG